MNTQKTLNISGTPEMVSILWNDENIFRSSLSELIYTLAKEIDSVFSLSVWIALKYEDHDELLGVVSRFDPFSDLSLYYEHSQLIALIKKYPFWHVSQSPKTQAMKTFIECEVKCRDTNKRIWSRSVFTTDRAVNSILYMAQERISSILGDIPNISSLPFEFGPGATYSVKNNTSPLYKLAGSLDVTRDCYAIAEQFLQSCPGWITNVSFVEPNVRRPLQLNVVKGDRLSFVPKTAKTDRPIAIGPTINVLLQKGIGSVIRQKLKPINNLNNREGVHRSLASQGSVDGSICTIDLSSASDTIAYALVQSLFPDDWFNLLCSCRSPQYEIDGQVYTYQKFSAMGNGYTFELESLIFYSLASATCRYLGLDDRSVSVFGDDIIAPTAAYQLLVAVLEECGFSINSEKSFSSGSFRESCGGDYLNGVDVRPFYLKDKLTYRTLFLFHNYLIRSGRQFSIPETYRKVRSLIGKSVIRHFKTWNPDEDGSLLDYSMPVGNYTAIKEYMRGHRHPQLRKLYGVSLLLYRLQLSDKQSLHNFKWDFERVRQKTKIVSKVYRYVHF